MPRIPGFVDAADTLASKDAAIGRTINLFLESTGPGQAKNGSYLRGAPGISLYVLMEDSPVRGAFAQDGRAFAVAGGTFYEITDNGDGTGTATPYGSVLMDGNPATMASNGSAGHQVMITSGGNGYIFDLDANTLLQITDGEFPTGEAAMCEFMDGYFFVLIANSRRFQISALEDGTDWDGLDIAERSEGSDNIAFLKRSHRDIFIVGTRTSEVWYDTGDALFPFAPIQGVFIEHGCCAPFTGQRFNNTIAWLGMNENGQGVAYSANGYIPERFSQYAQERYWQDQTELTSSTAWVYQQQGHLFYVVAVPPSSPPTAGCLLEGGQTTWAYDQTTQRWHERGVWDTSIAQYIPDLGTCQMFAFNQTLLGDRQSGALYTLSTCNAGANTGIERGPLAPSGSFVFVGTD